jgi:hypothetical protein
MVLEEGVKPLVVLRYTAYELIEQLDGGVTALQLRLIPLDETAVADKAPGALGVAVQDPEVVAAVACEDGGDDPAESTASTT